MLKQKYDVIVIGSGPGGLAAAIEAKKTGAEDVLIIERANWAASCSSASTTGSAWRF